MTCAARPANRSPLTRADAADHAVGRRALDQLVDATAAALRGDDDRAVLDERALVDEVGDVLAGRAPADLAAPLATASGRAASRPIAWRAMRLGEVGPDARRDRPRSRRRPPPAPRPRRAGRWRPRRQPSPSGRPTTRMPIDRCRSRRRSIAWCIFIDSISITCWPGAHRLARSTSIVTIVPCIGADTSVRAAPGRAPRRRTYRVATERRGRRDTVRA